MHQSKKNRRKINPKRKANLLSLITFFFTFEFLRKGYKEDILEDDVYEVLPQFKASKVGDKLEEEWLTEAGKKNPSIYKLLWSCYGRYYFLLGLPQLSSKIIAIVVIPRTSAKFLSYFKKDTELTKNDAIYYALLLIVLKFIICTYNHNYRFWITQLGIKMKIAFCSLIYRKVLKLKSSSLSKSGTGRIVTLMTKDVDSLQNIIIFLNDVWISVIIIILALYILCTEIGVAALIGMLFLLFVIPLQVYLGKLTSELRLKAAKATDCRLQITQETLSYIKIIKMYTWEKLFTDKISKAREEEMKKIKHFYFAHATFTEIGSFVMTLTLYIVITSYTKLNNDLTAEVVIFVQAVLSALRSPITISIPLGILRSAELVASVNRIKETLTEKEQSQTVKDLKSKPLVQIDKGKVEVNGHLILDDINITIKSGLNLVSGSLGSGKSLLLKVILGDYKLCRGEAKVTGTISYSSEDPWLFPASIKENILFGEQYNKERYHKVLKVCGLDFDINQFKKGDDTIIDDRGRNLSKGQQMRINLARAVYRDSDIYLLDDCLSSLDVHLQNFVFVECIKNFLRDKIVVMVTQNRRLLDNADSIFLLESGTVKRVEHSEISREEIDNHHEDGPLRHDGILDAPEEFKEKELTLLEETHQNIYYENPKKGKVDFHCYIKYGRFGGSVPILIFILVLYVASQTGLTYTDASVYRWVNIKQKISKYHLNSTNTTNYQDLLESDITTLYFYTATIIASVFFIIFRTFNYFSFAAKTTLNLHKLMLFSVVNAIMKFFDTRYFGNILNRFAKDVSNIDEKLPFNVHEFLKSSCKLGGIVIVIVSVHPFFIIPFIIFFIILFLMRWFYIPSGRSLQRLDCATRSPVIGHLNATLEGLTTIRACDAQEVLITEFDKHQDLYSSALYMGESASRAFAYSLDILCQLFITGMIIRFLIAEKDTQVGNVGLAITQAFQLTGLLQWGVREWANIENQMTSVERVLEYTNTEKENRSGRLLESLRSFGKVSYKEVGLKYANSKGYVLKNINFVINSGEKVGIVGRTGVGKSSLISILFRLYEYEGTITINDVDIKTLSLDFLRSSLMIIPQDSFVVTGTIRSNIDPTGLYKDGEIWDALNGTNLKELIPHLDQKCFDSGSNFSAGQKQLISLARALLSKNQIIILDETNANVDSHTETIIDNIINTNLEGCTVLIIAHKLQAVLDCDKVIVMDQGTIVEFDRPGILMDDENGAFYKMVKEANVLKKNT